jgi:hypothetical protein
LKNKDIDRLKSKALLKQEMDKLNQHKSDSSVSIKPLSETENNFNNTVV